MEIKSKIKSKTEATGLPALWLPTIAFLLLPLATNAQDADSGNAKSVIVATKAEDVPERCRRVYQRLFKELPEGTKVQVTVGQFYDMGHTHAANDFVPFIESAVPLNAKGRPHGEEQSFTREGRMTRTVSYVNGVKDGTEKIYRRGPRGKHVLATEIPWTKGRIEGVRKTFHPGGQLSSESPYKKGKAQGKARSFDAEGRLVSECTKKDGQLNGTLTDYWPDTGKPRRVINYKKGEVQGVAKEYYANGQLKREIPFKKGTMHGEEKRYEGDGSLARTKYWLEGQGVSKEEFRKRFRK